MNLPDFSVLMSVYFKERADYLRASLDSLIQQTVPPSEIVLVKDGPLTDELNQTIEEYRLANDGVFKIISLPTNMGLGIALQEGLLHCNFNLVARMDSDDIADPDRFRKQLFFFQEHPDTDVLGGSIAEFSDSPDNIYAYRTLPTSHGNLKWYAERRCPMNHMTVMYKKDKVIVVGGYLHFLGFEDYFLWMRMLCEGCIFRNLPDILVRVRAGEDMMRRRGGTKYLKSEVRLQWNFLQMGMIGWSRFVANVAVRMVFRLVPNKVRISLYSMLLRDNEFSNK
ncbi:MAG: glycosyltransferase [Cyclobacteriaceae bacterium]|nr:glycosyltransferase [Cyclobacteriaceae bacterium]